MPKINTHIRNFVWGTIFFTWLVFILAPLSPIPIPFEVIAYGLMAVVGSYTGIDQLAAVVTTRSLPKGTKYRGNREKLLKITVAIVFLTFTVIFLSLLFQDIPYPLSTILMSAFAVISFFVSGEKGKVVYESTGEEQADYEIEDLR